MIAEKTGKFALRWLDSNQITTLMTGTLTVGQKEKATKKVKALAAPTSIPQTREACAIAISEIGAARRKRQAIEAEMNEHLARIKEHYEQLAAPYNAAIVGLQSGVQTWCEANRDSLTQNGKVKTAAFTSGEVKWRITPPSVALKAAAKVIEALRKAGLDRFIRTKDEVNKDAILAEPDAVTGVAGITISQVEEFVIEPFDIKLDEVA
jgi:phage host-nuclease inhibitor protein Gam